MKPEDDVHGAASTVVPIGRVSARASGPDPADRLARSPGEGARRSPSGRFSKIPSSGRRLYSATVSHVTRRGAYAVFHAALAYSERDFRDGLRRVLGVEAEALASVGFGIVWDPISRSLVTEDVRAFLRRAEAINDPTGAAQIHVWLEQRLG